MATPPVFSAGSVLTAAQMNAVGLWLVKTQTMSSTASQNVDTCFTDDFENYLVMINITAVSASTQIWMRMRTGTTTNANSNYSYGGVNSYSGSNIVGGINSGGTDTKFVLSEQSTTDYPNLPMQVTVWQPKTAYRTSISSQGFTPVTPYPYARWLNGTMSVTTQYESFTLLTDTGSKTMSGTIRVYGYRN